MNSSAACKRAGWLLGSLAGLLIETPALAAGLPPLRVDPALLGGKPVPPAPAAPAPAPATGSAPSPAASAAEAAPPKSPAPEEKAAAPGPAREASAPAPSSARSLDASPAAATSAAAARSPAMTPSVVAPAARSPATTPFAGLDKTLLPTTVSADRIEGVNEQQVVAEGRALVQRGEDTLSADRIVYRQPEDEVEATGNVRLASPDTVMTGPRLRLRLSESVGEFEKPQYTIRHQRPPTPEPALTLLGLPAMDEGGHVLVQTGRMISRPPILGSGSAAQLEFRGKDQYRLHEATYSTCSPAKRDWEISIDTLDLDYTREEGSGRHATVRFMDTPILYLPWMNFSLNNQRKSGFLPPTIGSTSKSGLEVTAPWYWNIAPNMDATLTPRLMTRRGVQLNGEFRYLLDSEANRTQAGMPDKGQVRIEYLPSDRLANRDRYGYALIHTQNLGHGFSASLNLNGVSDDNYFSDLSTRVAQVSQGNLLRQGIVNYAGPWYAATLNLQGFQTLQNLSKPYQRLPQLTFQAFRYDLPHGLAFNLAAEYVNFDHPTNLLGKRTILYPQLSLPLATAALSLTPKIGVHITRYELAGLERPAAASWSAVPASQQRALPIFSLAGGAVLERDLAWFGRSLVQTLEPRAYYVFIPKRDQARIPVFDSGLADFNFAQMFSENRYTGGDRIGDANELTLAVTSRLIDPASGADLLRATIGTRHYFTDQSVTLPNETARTDRAADILATLAGQVLPRVYADVGWQYNPRDGRTERLNLGGRYRPAEGRVLNVAYRYSRNLLGQIDVSAQWPLFGGWHGVGRYNYSTRERRVIETIGGLEYDAGCWVGRFVIQRLATIADQPTTALFFQLELNDFSRIGSNPLQLLRRSIPGYGVINQPTADPVFAEN